MTKKKSLHEMRANYRASLRVLAMLSQMHDKVDGKGEDAFAERVRTAGGLVTYLRDRLGEEIRKAEK